MRICSPVAVLLCCGLFSLRATAATLGPETEGTYTDPALNKSGKYKLQLPSGATVAQPYGLLVFFHGSGGGPSYASIFAELSRVAAAYHLAPLAIQAPNGANSWPDASRTSQQHHVQYVNSLLDALVFKPHPEITRQRVVFVGLSAGSTFISGDYLPSEIGKYGGGAILLCGGGPPLMLNALNNSPLTADLKQHFKLFSYIQTGDFLFNQTTSGLRYWKYRGLTPIAENPPGGSHCGFAVGQALDQGITVVLGAP